MAIPDYQTIMLPLLKHLSDGRERPNAETIEALADEFGLTEDERKELLSSGRQTLFTNRVAWAKTYLKVAGLIESPRRGHYKITARGLEVLRQEPDRVDNTFLRKFPEFEEFLKTRVKGQKVVTSEQETVEAFESDRTPEEYLEYGYGRARAELTAELLSLVKDCSPTFFENLVIDLLLKMGYGGSRQEAARTVGRSGDGGIDGIIKEDRLGLDAIYIQAKRWEGNVGRPELQKFAGALQGQRARKGIFITTSYFTKDAEEYPRFLDSKIILINGEQLAHLMIDYDVGVTKVASYEMKKVDLDYFANE
jgi:restriction system protein